MTTLCDPGAPIGERIAQVMLSMLADGELSKSKRATAYRSFVDCGGNERLDLCKGTHCAVVAGAALHWAGRLAKLPRYPVSGTTSISSWLGELHFNSVSWRSYGTVGCAPVPGAISYVEADSNPLNNHVSVLLRELMPDLWLCGEGGAGDGSLMHFVVRKWDANWDKRRLKGLWVPHLLDHVTTPPDYVEGAPGFPIVKGDARRDVVKQLQRKLLANDAHCLPRYGADGGYGNETVAAVANAYYDLLNVAFNGVECRADLWSALP